MADHAEVMGIRSWVRAVRFGSAGEEDRVDELVMSGIAASRRFNGRRFVAIGRLPKLLAVSVLAMVVAGCSSTVGPVGDPGGKILSKLEGLRAAVPNNAKVVVSSGKEPMFTGSCASTRANVEYLIAFVSPSPLAEVIGQ